MKLLVACAVSGLEFVFGLSVVNIALLAKVEVETVFAFVPDSDNRHGLAAVALDILFDLLSWFYNHLDVVGFVVVASDFVLVHV